jgi:dCTP deaminase
MILSDKDIFHRVVNVKDLQIRPWDQDRIRSASYELALSPRFLLFDPTVEVIDPLDLKDYTTEVNIDDNEGKYYDQGYLVLHPGEFVIGSTVETIRFPHDLVGQMNGKSSLGRLGLQVHATAGYFDPGFCGTATLEMSNVSRLPIRLWPGMLVAQMVFQKMVQATEQPYGHPSMHSHYQNQSGPTASRYGQGVGQLRLPGVHWDEYDKIPTQSGS